VRGAQIGTERPESGMSAGAEQNGEVALDVSPSLGNYFYIILYSDVFILYLFI